MEIVKRCQSVVNLRPWSHDSQGIIEGCSNIAKHTMIKPSSGIKTRLCDEHFYQLKRVDLKLDYYKHESLMRHLILEYHLQLPNHK